MGNSSAKFSTNRDESNTHSLNRSINQSINNSINQSSFVSLNTLTPAAEGGFPWEEYVQNTKQCHNNY